MIRYRLRQRLSDGSLWTSAVIFEAATPRHVAQAVIAGFLSGEPRWAIEEGSHVFLFGLDAKGQQTKGVPS
jgi:hypothetical protein